MRVLARPAFRNRGSNPYNALIYDAMRAQGVRVSEYHGAGWLWERHDVFHVHWPESAFNHGLMGGYLTSQTLLRAMDHLRARGTRCVWTAHNLAAHERRFPRAEERAWRAFMRRIDGFFSLSQDGLTAVQDRFPELRDAPGFVTAHPHFRGAYPDTVARSEARAALGVPVDARVVSFVGRILEYKNVPELVRVFARTAGDAELRLLIAGEPRTRELAQGLRAAAASDERLVLSLKHVAGDELQLFLRAADLVVLPYREIFNSGSALLSLSFDRPVLMPRSAAARELQASCGEPWVQTYELLTPDVLLTALAAARSLEHSSTEPLLSPRAPGDIARQTVAAYADVLARPLRGA